MTLTRDDWCHIGYAIIGLCVVTPLLLLLTDSRTCVTLTQGTLEPSAAVPGDVVRMTYNAQEHLACGGYVVRRFIGSDKVIRETIREPTVYHEVINARESRFSVPVTIPLLPPGPTVYAPVVYRWRNPIQKFWPTRDDNVPRVTFTVLPSR